MKKKLNKLWRLIVKREYMLMNEVTNMTNAYKKQFIEDIINKMTHLCDNS